jgi:hypothetical protein
MLVEEGRLDEARRELTGFAPEGPAIALGAMGPAMLSLALPICLRLGDDAQLRRLYAGLLPLEARHAVNMGLLVGDGPVAYHLGRIAERLGDRRSAAAHLRDAVVRCRACGFGLLEARAARSLEALGEPPRDPAPPVADDAPPSLRRDGELWVLSHAGREARHRDSKGVHYLAALLRDPGRELHVGELVGLAAGGPGDAGELLDARAKAAYRRRLEALRDALEDAEARGDREGVGRLEDEREALAGELGRAVGLGGRDRRAGAASERARINVQRRLRDVVERVAEVDPALGRHLDLHVRTGVFCSWRL